eukprot:scaffold15406_cov119-Isochrysis_galbana.AAC.7
MERAATTGCCAISAYDIEADGSWQLPVTTPAWDLDNYKPGSWRLLTTSKWAALWTSTPLGYQEEALGAPIEFPHRNTAI